MKNFYFDAFLGLAGFAAGLVGVGYAIGTKSKINQVNEKLDRSIDILSKDVKIDCISQDIVNKAVEKAVDTEAKLAVTKAIRDVNDCVRLDMKSQISSAVSAEYLNLKEKVLKEMTEKVSKIDVNQLKADVIEAAKEQVAEKLDGSMDDILEKFNDDLKNVSKIYKSIANTMTGTNGREMTFRIG